MSKGLPSEMPSEMPLEMLARPDALPTEAKRSWNEDSDA
jgi:hypothetical protein